MSAALARLIDQATRTLKALEVLIRHATDEAKADAKERRR